MLYLFFTGQYYLVIGIWSAKYRQFGNAVFRGIRNQSIALWVYNNVRDVKGMRSYCRPIPSYRFIGNRTICFVSTIVRPNLGNTIAALNPFKRIRSRHVPCRRRCTFYLSVQSVVTVIGVACHSSIISVWVEKHCIHMMNRVCILSLIGDGKRFPSCYLAGYADIH